MLSLLQDGAVVYYGQPIAVVVADTLEHAVTAARRADVRHTLADAVLDFDRAKRSAHKPDKILGGRYHGGVPKRTAGIAPTSLSWFTALVRTAKLSEPQSAQPPRITSWRQAICRFLSGN